MALIQKRQGRDKVIYRNSRKTECNITAQHFNSEENGEEKNVRQLISILDQKNRDKKGKKKRKRRINKCLI